MEYSSNYCGVMLHANEITTETLGTLYNTLYHWHGEIDGLPSYGGLSGDGFSGKVLKFPRQHARLKKAGFTSLESFDLYTPLPDAEYPNAQWSIYSCVSREKKRVIICASTSLVALDLAGTLMKIVGVAIELTQARYGYGFYRDRKRGGAAEFYAIGMPVYITDPTPNESKEARLIQGWGFQAVPAQLYLQGILRDVYPWNFLNATQLAMPIEGQPLKAWIEADTTRGNLHSGYEPLTLWELTESQCAAIRPSLQTAGIPFNGTLP